MGSANEAKNERYRSAVRDRQADGQTVEARGVVLLRLGLAGCVLLGLVPFGSTGPFAGNLASLAFALTAAAAAWTTRATFSAWPIRWALLSAAFLVVYVLLQAAPGVPGMSPNPIWEEAGRLLGSPIAGSVSVAPATSLATIPLLATPFLVFAASLWLLREDAHALWMLRFLAYAGGTIAVFGLVQFGFFPETLLLSEKRAYLDSVTTVFVNRNSAATYLGTTIILLAALIAIEMRGTRVRTFLAMMVAGRSGMRRYRSVLELALLLLCIFALMLTRSRAGTASTVIALTVFAALASRGPIASSNARSFDLRRFFRPLAAAICVLVLLCGTVLLFGGQTILRARTRGLDDGRFCGYPDIWSAAREAWPYGTGAGTFEVVFPKYRNPDCGLYGVWDRAHQFYLEGLLTIGLAMPALCVLVYAVLLMVLARGLRARRRYRAVPAAGISVLLLVTMHDMVDFSLQIPGIAFNTAVLLAACCAVSLGGGTGRTRDAKAPAASRARRDD